MIVHTWAREGDPDLGPQLKTKKVNVEATIHNSHYGKMILILISYHIILKK
jgi:hypothetical protein